MNFVPTKFHTKIRWAAGSTKFSPNFAAFRPPFVPTKGISFGWMICSLGPLRHMRELKEIVLAAPTSLANSFEFNGAMCVNFCHSFNWKRIRFTYLRGRKFLPQPTLSWLKPAFPRNQGPTHPVVASSHLWPCAGCVPAHLCDIVS